MCIIKPFSAFRPAPEIVANVATHSVERYSKEKIKHILDSNPVSFLQVIHPPEIPSEGTEERLHSIKSRFNDFILKNIFVHDASPCFYIYRQIKNGRHHIGIIGLASVEDYKSNSIKIHEQTLALREEKLKEYLDVCEFNAEPVCLTYPHNKGLNEIMHVKIKQPPLYDYTIDEISHSVWIINKPGEIEQIQNLFKNIPAIYIADGHHRAASSARLAEKRKAANPAHTGNEPYNFFTAALFADDELTIFSYNRMVQNLNEHSIDSFLTELKKKFKVTTLTATEHEPTQKKTLSLYARNQWYSIDISELVHTHDPVSNLDVSVLSDYILSPVLDIHDLRNDKRISFIPGIRSKDEIEKIVDSGKAAAVFCLYPVSFEELIAVANSGKEMPPKSTWIEPKLESGLLIYSLEEKND
jgi:uncharacterized protein (DUF1015 family)